MGMVTATAVVYNPDKSVFCEFTTKFNFLSPEMQKVFEDGLVKQQKYLSDMKANQKKEPDAIYSALLTTEGASEGDPSITFEAFTYDMYQKALSAWNKTLEDVLKAGEKYLKKS